MKIIGTGLSGLVGSRIVELFSSKHTFEDLSLETGVDITDYSLVNKRIEDSQAPWIFHFAAYTDVQGAEKEKSLGEESRAWKINVGATQNICTVVNKLGMKLVYIDTDYAFDGKDQEYTEVDTPNPLSWYGQTKYEGAKRVLALGEQGLVVRIANPFRANPIDQTPQSGKKDFVHKMIDRLSAGLVIRAPIDQLFVPTYIDDIAVALEALIRVNAFGLYHVVGGKALSPYETGKIIAKTWGFDEGLVEKTTFAEYFKDRAPIPQYANLGIDKIAKLGIHMRTCHEGLHEVVRIERNSE